jgi:hypothetical protein
MAALPDLCVGGQGTPFSEARHITRYKHGIGLAGLIDLGFEGTHSLTGRSRPQPPCAGASAYSPWGRDPWAESRRPPTAEQSAAPHTRLEAEWARGGSEGADLGRGLQGATQAGPRQAAHQGSGAGPRAGDEAVADPVGERAMARVTRLATQCHLLGALSEAIVDGFVDVDPGPGPQELVKALRDGVRRRARETWDLGRLGTALEWMVDFLADTRRDPFVPLEHAGDLQAAIYNMETLEMFYEYIRVRGSRQHGRRGTPLASDTIAGYVSAIRLLRNQEAHYLITCEAVDVRMGAAAKRTRQTQGPPGARQLRRGLRSKHFRRLVTLGFDRLSLKGLVRWAAALVAHNLLLRGGELGVVDAKVFDPTRDATFGAIEFKEPSADSDHCEWLTWDVVPIKDTAARRRVCPMAVRRRQRGGSVGTDPLCTFDAIIMAWRAQTGTAPPARGRALGALALQPFFRGANGVWRTTDTRVLAQDMAVMLGMPATEVGAKSFRIGGATDWRDVFKSDAERIITERGRWDSDIGAIYQRALAEAHLRGSAAVGEADGADLESLCKGWVQPANFR